MALKRGRKTVSYSGSMVEPANSYAHKAWQKQPKPSQPKKWLLPLIIGIVLFVIILIAIIALPAKEPTDEYETGLPEPEISDEEDLSSYYAELVSEPDYEPDFTYPHSRYSAPPTNITCDSLKKVSKMNADMLNLFLDRGYIIVVSGKGDYPYSAEGKSFLIYYGIYADYTYRAIPINCPTKIDASSRAESFTSVELFDNLNSDQQYFAWIDPKYLNQDRKDF